MLDQNRQSLSKNRRRTRQQQHTRESTGSFPHQEPQHLRHSITSRTVWFNRHRMILVVLFLLDLIAVASSSTAAAAARVQTTTTTERWLDSEFPRITWNAVSTWNNNRGGLLASPSVALTTTSPDLPLFITPNNKVPSPPKSSNNVWWPEIASSVPWRSSPNRHPSSSSLITTPREPDSENTQDMLLLRPGSTYLSEMKIPIIGKQVFRLLITGSNTARLDIQGRILRLVDDNVLFTVNHTNGDISLVLSHATYHVLRRFRTRLGRVAYDMATDEASLEVQPPLPASIRLRFKRVAS